MTGVSYRKAFSQFFENYRKTIFVHYVQAPVGVVVILFLAFWVDMVIDTLPFTLPASVICLILVLLFLILAHWLSPHFLFHHAHRFLDPAADLLLASMGLFFASSFILIPRRDPMPAREVGLIIALFLPPFFVSWFGTMALCKLLAHLWPSEKLDVTDQDNNADVLDGDEQGHGSEINEARSPHDSRTNSALTLPGGEAADPPGPSASPALTPPEDKPRQQNHQELAIDVNATMTNNDMIDPQADLEKAEFSDKQVNPFSKGISKLRQATRAFVSTDASRTPEENLAQNLEKWFDAFVYFVLFLVGIPLFFSPGGETRSFPLFTGVVVLSWLFSRRVVPQAWQVVLHPILVTSFITVFVVWALGAIKGLSLTEVLNHYSTGATYLVLFRRGRGWDGSSPSAGDLMATLLVGGIVVLAFPLFRYRWDLYNNFFRLIAVVIPNTVLSLLLWPWVGRLIGLNGDRAITFAARFLSTPFGVQFIVATGGDSSLVVVLICITGILAVLLRDPLFKLCRTRVKPGSDEYFVIGCTIGVIAAAVGTSSLMAHHSRAAATSTVMFALYGLILLGLVAIPDIALYIGQLAGL